jgi:hypothetical protein
VDVPILERALDQQGNGRSARTMGLRADGNNETSVFPLLFHGHLLISEGILIRKQLACVAERHGRLPRPALAGVFGYGQPVATFLGDHPAAHCPVCNEILRSGKAARLHSLDNVVVNSYAGLLRQSQQLVHETAVNLLAFIAHPTLHRKLRGIVRHPFPSQSNGRSPIVHSFGGSPSAVFWYSQLPQTVQFQLLLIFVMWPGDPI